MKDIVRGVTDTKHLQNHQLFVRQNMLHSFTFQINLFCSISTEGKRILQRGGTLILGIQAAWRIRNATTLALRLP